MRELGLIDECKRLAICRATPQRDFAVHRPVGACKCGHVCFGMELGPPFRGDRHPIRPRSGAHNGFHGNGSPGWDAGGGDDCDEPSSYFVHGQPIKAICRELDVSREVDRNILTCPGSASGLRSSVPRPMRAPICPAVRSQRHSPLDSNKYFTERK